MRQRSILILSLCLAAVGCARHFVDQAHHPIAIFTAHGDFVRAIGDAPGEGQLQSPQSVAVDPVHGGNILAADPEHDRVVVFSPSGSFIRSIGSKGIGDGQLRGPQGVAVDPINGGNVIVADTGNDRVVVFSATGKFIRTIAGRGDRFGKLYQPVGVAVDTANNANVVIHHYDEIVVVTSTGTFIRSFGNSPGPASGCWMGVAVDTRHQSHVLISDSTGNRIVVLDASGLFLGTIAAHPVFHSDLQGPTGVAAGPPSGDIVIADAENGRVEVYGADDSFVRSIDAISPRDRPYSAAVDPSNGNVIVANPEVPLGWECIIVKGLYSVSVNDSYGSGQSRSLLGCPIGAREAAKLTREILGLVG